MNTRFYKIYLFHLPSLILFCLFFGCYKAKWENDLRTHFSLIFYILKLSHFNMVYSPLISTLSQGWLLFYNHKHCRIVSAALNGWCLTEHRCMWYDQTYLAFFYFYIMFKVIVTNFEPDHKLKCYELCIDV